MAALIASLLLAVIPAGQEGDAQAFTSLTDEHGKSLADGRYSQWVKDGILHIEARYDFPGGRTAVEQATLRLEPKVEQLSWRWTEKNGQTPLREMSIDFLTGNAHSDHFADKKHWDETVKITPGYTFAGIGFITAVKAMRERMKPGEWAELHAIAMTPKPREATVKVTHDGPQRIRMADRTLDADRFTIHPEVPAIAKLFVKVADEHIWLVAGKPAAFLRYEGPLCESDDPIVHVDLIAGPPAQGRRP
jgi:hypothetical protein